MAFIRGGDAEKKRRKRNKKRERNKSAVSVDTAMRPLGPEVATRTKSACRVTGGGGPLEVTLGIFILTASAFFSTTTSASGGIKVEWEQLAKDQLDDGGPGRGAGPASRYASPLASLPNGSLVTTHGYYYGMQEDGGGDHGARWLDDTWMHTGQEWVQLSIGKGRYVPSPRYACFFLPSASM